MQARTAYSDPPDWVEEAVIYQIFPDRFRRSGRVKEQRNLHLKPWGSDPSLQGFQGGDLYGVIDALDHIQSMGVTCLYLTPIFSSASNHRYHAYDYFQVDPLLGGNASLDALITAVHARGMRLVLDGVFNHCGRGFWAFHHVVENGQASPYRDWFHIKEWPINPYPRDGETCGYDCWWSIADLPKFNHSNPAVREHLLAVARRGPPPPISPVVCSAHLTRVILLLFRFDTQDNTHARALMRSFPSPLSPYRSNGLELLLRRSLSCVS